jgi:hypothetical protein
MNDFSEIERELKKLRPVRPSQRLVSAVERALEEMREARPTAPVFLRKYRFALPQFRLSWGLGLAAAAALVLIFLRLNWPTPSRVPEQLAAGTPKSAAAIPPVPSAQFIPTGATQVVYHTRDEGLVFPKGATQPVRRVRSHTRESLQWRNPKTGASLVVSYPTEQVRLIPVSGQ